eukprot:360002-Chlamydomonas_euryale.AAC.4
MEECSPPDLHHSHTAGSCGYTNGDGSLPFPKETYAAAADANTDYPGSCGRCYEVRCESGLVNEKPGQMLNITNGFFGGDEGRPYLPAIEGGSDFVDTAGRCVQPTPRGLSYMHVVLSAPRCITIQPTSTHHFFASVGTLRTCKTASGEWPGNPAEDAGNLAVSCWDEEKVIRVVIADSCPCIQVLPDGAPGVKPGGETRTQNWCCGSAEHFDLSYWAFEQLAHPVYGVMTISYRPVDCYSGEELPLTPGFISDAIYKDVPQAGWSFFPYLANDQQVSVPGARLVSQACPVEL